MIRTIPPNQIVALTAEAAITLTTLALFLCAYHHEARTVLWEAGGERGWNSAPHHPASDSSGSEQTPEVPLIWSQSLATSNIGISLLAATICLARIALILSELQSKAIPCFYDLILSGLWAWSVWAQSSADLTDSEHPSMRPWYLMRSCSEVDGRCFQACRMAKVSFAFTIISMTFYVARGILSIMQMTCWSKERKQVGGVGVFCYHPLDHQGRAKYSTISGSLERTTSHDEKDGILGAKSRALYSRTPV